MSMSSASRSHGAEQDLIVAEILRLHRQRGETWLRGDAEGYLSSYWDDANMFAVDARVTIPQVRRWFLSVLEAGGGPLSMDLPLPDDVAISSEGDAVTTSYEWRMHFREADGVVSDRTYYETNVWYRRDDTWKIILLHVTRLSFEIVSNSDAGGTGQR